MQAGTLLLVLLDGSLGQSSQEDCREIGTTPICIGTFLTSLSSSRCMKKAPYGIQGLKR
jgi:hypothetical protein